MRGAGVFGARASFELRLGAWIIDGALGLSVFFLLHRAFGLSPVPSIGWTVTIVASIAALWIAGRLALGRSLGESAWRLRPGRPGLGNPLKDTLLRPGRIESRESATAVLLTTASIILCAWSIDLAIFRQPLWARAETLELEATLPEMSSGRWEVLPFFYSLGAWPREYAGKPVLYSLPYEKGPPSRFVGHVVARWEAPDTRVTFEGPKTPQSAQARVPGERTPRDRIRQCLVGGMFEKSWSCLKTREATLMRHLEEMQERLAGDSGGNTALSMRWSLRWFTVRNPSLPASDQAQGIYLSARSIDGAAAGKKPRGEERYVLVTENGTHQAIALTYANPGSPEAQSARAFFEQAIRSLRASDDLAPGREWIDRRLQSVRLPELLSQAGGAPGSRVTGDSARILSQLAQAQALLLSKISVQPGTYDSYFHLGGTALVLSRLARASALAGQLQGIEVAAAAKPLVHNAYRFAMDVAPSDPRTTQLQGFWLEAQKN